MIDWTARAKSKLSSKPAEATDGTDESRVTSVSSAPIGVHRRDPPALSPVSSVLSVARSANEDLQPSAFAAPVRRSGNPYMTPEQGDECHEGGWNDAEIQSFITRSVRFSALGRVDAQQLAERLTLRDRHADDRHLCVECRELEASGRCAAARRGTLAHTDRRFEPSQNILIRCPAFSGGDSSHR